MLHELYAPLALFGVVFLGGVVSYLLKQYPLDTGQSAIFILFSMGRTVTVSIFAAYLIYLSCREFLLDVDKRMALAGFASFAGADLLRALQGSFINWLTKKILGEKNDDN